MVIDCDDVVTDDSGGCDDVVTDDNGGCEAACIKILNGECGLDCLVQI